MVRAVFIDIDNTLLDFDAYVEQSLRQGFRQFHMTEFEDWMLPVFHRVNGSLWHRIEEGTLSFEELQRIRFRWIFEALHVQGNGPAFERYFRDCLNESAIPVKGAREMLEALKGRYILCTASNGPYAQQVHRLELAGMASFFRQHFISEMIGVTKPDRRFFETALEEVNREQARLSEEEIAPFEVLVLGDSLTSDIAGGIGCGFKTCYFNTLTYCVLHPRLS